MFLSLTKDSFDFFRLLSSIAVCEPVIRDSSKISPLLDDETFGGLAYLLSMQLPARRRTFVVPFSMGDFRFCQCFCQEVGGTILSESDLSGFSQPKGASIILATLFVNDKLMERVEPFIADLRSRKVVIVDFIVAAVINDCERKQSLKIVSALDRGDFLPGR